METDWELLVTLFNNFYIETRSKEIILFFKQRTVFDGWFESQGKQINIPFRPHCIVLRVDTRDPGAIDRLYNAAACCLL